MQTSNFDQAGQNLRTLLQHFDWEQAREQVNREGRARILLLGLAGAGKSTLFNALCRWDISAPAGEQPPDLEVIEDFGLFCLVDLPEDTSGASDFGLGLNSGFGDYFWHNPAGMDGGDDLAGGIPPGMLEPLDLAETADLLVYVLDAVAGVRLADFRWLARLRRLGVPLVVALNKCDAAEDDSAARAAELESRLAAPVIPVSALHGANISEQLLPKMVNLCPGLTVALGRELGDFKQRAARRVVNQAALLNGLFALEPVPLLDLPMQALTITGMLLRISAIYERPPGDMQRREVWMAVGGGLAGRYVAQQLVKFLPVVGWLISGMVGWSCTWGLGRAMLLYLEAGGDETINRRWRGARGQVSKLWQAARQKRPSLPRRYFWSKSGRQSKTETAATNAGVSAPDALPRLPNGSTPPVQFSAGRPAGTEQGGD